MDPSSEPDRSTKPSLNGLTEVTLTQEVEAVAAGVINLTGYTLEELLLQVIATNYPALLPDLADFLDTQSDPRTTLPLWFHLGPSQSTILQKLAKKYENRYSIDQLVNALLLLGIEFFRK